MTRRTIDEGTLEQDIAEVLEQWAGGKVKIQYHDSLEAFAAYLAEQGIIPQPGQCLK